MEVDKNNADWTDTLFSEEEEDTLKNKYLAFQIEDQEYAIEIRYVLEIVGIQKITEVPDMPKYVLGVINLRGKVIPIIDVRKRFQMAERAYDNRTCIIVVALQDTTVGLVVDCVAEVLMINEEAIDPPPAVNRGHGSHYIMGMGKVGEAVKILIDLNRLLGDEVEQLEQV
ncbi:MAG: chemotaxis protein CheW [Planctomycetes bacterium]|nr:chemotaxis protein CheW [Planctomycetota bacterium]